MDRARSTLARLGSRWYCSAHEVAIPASSSLVDETSWAPARRVSRASSAPSRWSISRMLSTRTPLSSGSSIALNAVPADARLIDYHTPSLARPATRSCNRTFCSSYSAKHPSSVSERFHQELTVHSPMSQTHQVPPQPGVPAQPAIHESPKRSTPGQQPVIEHSTKSLVLQ